MQLKQAVGSWGSYTVLLSALFLELRETYPRQKLDTQLMFFRTLTTEIKHFFCFKVASYSISRVSQKLLSRQRNIK